MRECWLREWSPLSIHVIILDTVHQCLDIREYFMGGAHVTYSRTTGCRKSWLAICGWYVLADFGLLEEFGERGVNHLLYLTQSELS